MDPNSLENFSSGTAVHQPVMVREVLELLQPVSGGFYLDGTLGLGGHSLQILRACQGRCSVLGMDMDEHALDLAGHYLEEFSNRIHIFRDSYHRFDRYLHKLGWEALDGALLDLGMSSLQLDTRERGFSFIHEGPLDMRMGTAQGFEPAARLVQTASFARLKKIIHEYGEEPMAGRIARAIVQTREEKPLSTTLDLARIVEQAYPAQRRRAARNHPATKTFQALRIAVNKELENLEKFLYKIPDNLRPGARLVIISFHSLEDRIVKHFLRKQASECLCPPRTPVCTCKHQKKFSVLTRKPMTASDAEKIRNPRSRSAKLRAARKTDSGKRGKGTDSAQDA